MTQALNELFWHDGRLLDISFSIDAKGESSVVLSALFYKDEQAPQRDTYQIKCQGVSRFTCTLDVAELKDNMGAGNISNAYLKGETLWVYFSDGLLEIHAKQFLLGKS